MSTNNKSAWTASDTAKLVKWVSKNKASAGNGLSFKMAKWEQCVVSVNKIQTCGAPKDGKVCSNKWNQVYPLRFVWPILMNFCSARAPFLTSGTWTKMPLGSLGILIRVPQSRQRLKIPGKPMLWCACTVLQQNGQKLTFNLLGSSEGEALL